MRSFPSMLHWPAMRRATSVQFTQDGTQIGIATNVPYQAHVLPCPKPGSTTVIAVAVDQFGNVGVPAILTIAVETNVLPSVQFVRVSPASGPVPTGSSFTVNVVASGNAAILFQYHGESVGTAQRLPTATFQTLGTNLLVTGSVPATNIAGQQVQNHRASGGQIRRAIHRAASV